jgi:putative transposase
MSRKPYPSDLSDAEWEKIKPLLPEANKLGSPRIVDLREILVDVLGLMLGIFISAANETDSKMAPNVLVPVLDEHQKIEVILADQSYQGELIEEVEAAYGSTLEIVQKLGEGFVVQPWRWVVERTFSWLDNARGICRVFEAFPENHEGMIFAASIRLMLRKLTKQIRNWAASS